MTRRPRPFPHRAAQGFTLVELVIVIVLLGVIAALGSVMLREGFNAYFAGRDLTDADWQARVALGRMTRELREVPSAADLVSIAPTTQITFRDFGGTQIQYALNGTTLERNAVPLADGITALGFSYLDDTQTATAAPAAVRYITVQFTVVQGGTNMSFRATVNPRNLL